MKDRTAFRLKDIIEAIEHIDHLLLGKSFEDVQNDRILRAAFERFLEIISEASRHIPDGLKSQAPEIPWRRIGDIGNHLRHAYNRVDAEILWRLHEKGDLAQLEQIVRLFISKLPVNLPKSGG